MAKKAMLFTNGNSNLKGINAKIFPLYKLSATCLTVINGLHANLTFRGFKTILLFTLF